MDLLFLLVYCAVNSICISLHLPNSDRESPLYNIVQDVEYSHTPFHPASLLHLTITYESKTDELIDEVYYFGALIFHDEGHDPPPSRRIVTYTLTGRKIVISIHPNEIDKNTETNFFEAQYILDHEGIYDVAHNVPCGIHIVNNNANAVKEAEIMGFLSKRDFEEEMMPLFPSFNIVDFVASRIFRGRFRRATADDSHELYERAGGSDDDYQLRGNLEAGEQAANQQNEPSGDLENPQEQAQPRQHDSSDYARANDLVDAESAQVDTLNHPKSSVL